MLTSKTSFNEFLKAKEVEEMDPETQQEYLRGKAAAEEHRVKLRREKAMRKRLETEKRQQETMGKFNTSGEGVAAFAAMQDTTPRKAKAMGGGGPDVLQKESPVVERSPSDPTLEKYEDIQEIKDTLLDYMEKYDQMDDNAQLRSMLMGMEGPPLDSDDGDDEEYREGS